MYRPKTSQALAQLLERTSQAEKAAEGVWADNTTSSWGVSVNIHMSSIVKLKKRSL